MTSFSAPISRYAPRRHPPRHRPVAAVPRAHNTIESRAQRDTRQQYVVPARKIADTIVANATQDVGKLNARYGSIANALKPYGASGAAAWGQAATAEKGVGSALASGLVSQGQQLGGDISAKLAGIQAPGQAVQQFGGGTAATGAGAGQAMGALSSADLQRLNSSGTAEQVYAAAFPRLAALTADQERRGLLSDYARELADKQAEASAGQQQSLVENRRYYTEQQQQRKATAYAHHQDTIDRRRQAKLDRLATIAAAQEYGLNVGKFKQSEQRVQQGAARVQLAERRQGESEREFEIRERRLQQQFHARMRAAAQRTAQTGQTPDASLSAKYGYIVDHQGRPILTKNGKKIPVVKGTTSATKRPYD
jgi:hypothetical protein